MKTQRLYEEDSHIREFRATVLSCEKSKNGFEVVLDRTAFFPEGGGQPADTGKIGEAGVRDVRLREETIVHFTDAPLEIGSEYDCILDWEKRFARMQNHSAEHIVSGLFHAKYGCNNVGFHMGSESVTLDLDIPLDGSQIAEVEKEANLAIVSDLPVKAWYPDPEELASLDYRSKLDLKSGVRLVRIGAVDLCACCAPHVKTTGEIGLVRILSHMPNKGGTRIEMLAGFDALADYARLHEENAALMRLFSAKRKETVASAEKMQENLNAVRSELRRLKEQIAWESLSRLDLGDIFAAFVSPCTYDEMRYCLNRLREEEPGHKVFCVFSGSAQSDEKLYMIASEASLKAFVSEMNASLCGKGGGRPDFAQGRVTCGEDGIRAFLTAHVDFFR